ncbi:hypothetical protein C3481_13595 [Microbacterium sp. Ru50]|uniref:lipopolysaccharide biosynthesis protein n=1 Tax=Microbacterium sp. Ru50 TaxID=2080744 RepID=UPI000CDDD295|nr:hypothetical protein [Microbacterium sp. Ru50]POX65917.1 hypothetical protein C3481_13595 [Microbacterium sp. Ru50]
MNLRRGASFSLYLVAPLLGAVTPLLVYPSVTTHFGAIGLGAVGVAQSLGSAAAIVGELGWSVVGPQRVAGADASGRAQIVKDSLASRLVFMLVLLPLAAVIAMSLVPGSALDVAILTVGFGLTGLSVTWALIGANRPGLMLILDSLPRLALVGAVVLALQLGAPLWVYGVGLAIASVFASAAGSAVFRAPGFVPVVGPGRTFQLIRSQAVITLSRTVSAGFTALPVTLVALAAPTQVPLFAAVDRMCRMALAVLSAVPNRLQSWVGQARGAELLRRNRRQLEINALLGLAAAVAYSCLLPFVATFVFTGVVEVSPLLAALSGAVVLTVCVSRGLGLGLVAFRKTNWLLAVSVVACLVGVSSVIVLSTIFGAAGAVGGVLAAEAAGAVFQLIVLTRAVRAAGAGEGRQG